MRDVLGLETGVSCVKSAPSTTELCPSGPQRYSEIYNLRKMAWAPSPHSLQSLVLLYIPTNPPSGLSSQLVCTAGPCPTFTIVSHASAWSPDVARRPFPVQFLALCHWPIVLIDPSVYTHWLKSCLSFLGLHGHRLRYQWLSVLPSISSPKNFPV